MSQDSPASTRLEDIYRQLEVGRGHELVNDQNVGELIDIATQKGNETITQILREWRANCDPGSEDQGEAAA